MEAWGKNCFHTYYYLHPLKPLRGAEDTKIHPSLPDLCATEQRAHQPYTALTLEIGSDQV